jgi:hypothetical protein
MSAAANPLRCHWRSIRPIISLTVKDGVATVTLNHPERKILTFSYRELTDFSRACAMDDEVKTIVVSRRALLSSGGDVFGSLVRWRVDGAALRPLPMTAICQGDGACPQPIIAAVDGICAGAGAIIAMASDMRLAPEARSPCSARWPWLRHGRLRDPAAHHRLIAGVRLLYTALHDRGGGRALGLLQPYCGAGASVADAVACRADFEVRPSPTP